MNPNPLVRTVMAAALLVVPVSVQLALPEIADSTGGHLTFAVSQLLGWLLILSVARRLPATAARRGRFGRRSVLFGLGCQVAFALIYAVTSLDAKPLEASFVLFLLGFLAIAIGGTTWGTSLVRVAERRTAGWGIIGVGVLGLLAMLVGGDPFHDVFLLASYAAWVLVGHGVTRTAARRVDAPVAVSETPL